MSFGAAAFAQQLELTSKPIELARLVDLASERLKVTVHYDPAALKTQVVVRQGAALSDEALWGTLNELLEARGHTTIRGGDAGRFSVVKLNEAAGLVRENPVPSPTRGATGTEPIVQAGFDERVIRVRHRSPASLAAELQPALSKPGGSITVIGDSVAVADLRSRLPRIEAAIAALDTPEAQAVTREFRLRHAAAAAAAKSLRELTGRMAASGQKLAGEVVPVEAGGTLLVLAPASEVPRWETLIASVDTPEATSVVVYPTPPGRAAELAEFLLRSFRSEGTQQANPTIAADPAGDLLSVTATPALHESIRAALDALPREAGPHKELRSFVVRNRSVREVCDVLLDLLSSGAIGEIDAAGSAHVDETAFLPRTPVGDVPARVPDPERTAATSVTVDEGTNTIIAYGEPRHLEEIASLITQLDVRQSQVMLEVLMLSLSESKSVELGVELQDITIAGDVRIRLASLFGLGTRGAAEGESAGLGFTGVVLSPGDFSVLVRALEAINRGRSLSMPKLLVANNQDAVLNSVLEQPFASINASDTVATTSYGGTKPAGTQVSITPQIAEGDSLILSYRVSLSAFVGASRTAALPPPSQVNNLNSVVTIPDGYTVVVGGIELASDSKGTTQVPGIGNVPVLGELFKSRSNTSSRSRFYVFIRAHILRDNGFEDLKHISERDLARTGVDDGWPVLEPRVIR